MNGATSDAAGQYELRGIPAGTYRIQFHDGLNGDYLDEVFDDAMDLDSGADVVVGAANVTGIDAELAMASKITGTVTGPDGETPLEGIEVTAYARDESWHGWSRVADDRSDAAGAYAVGGLTAGMYRVVFDDWWHGNYVKEVYSNAVDLDSGLDVVVAATTTVTGIDASLALASKITGTVTGPDGETPLEGIWATPYSWNESGGYWGAVNWGESTDAAGTYLIGGLTAGTYRVEFWDWDGNYLREVYDNAPDIDSGTNVVVGAGEIVTEIDASLELASKISGRVTGPDGETPLEGVWVQPYGWNESGGDWREVVNGGDSTDAAGAYLIGGLPAGTYRVEFWDWDGNYLREAYDNAPDIDSGTNVVAGAGEIVTEIDASLELASKISGRVTGPDGETPLEGIQATAYQWDDTLEGWDWVTSRQTDSDGNYEIGGLLAGTYRVSFQDDNGLYSSEAYSNAADVASGHDIVVAAGETAAGIDAELAEALKISGRVTGMDGTTALEDIYVDAYGWNGADWEYHAGTDTDVDGNYELGGLAAGTYRVRFNDQTATYLTEIHDDVVWRGGWDGGTDVVLAEGVSATGINAALSLPSAAITGTVTSENGATPFQNLYVLAYRRAGSQWDFIAEDYTDAAGFYELSGFGAGTYRVVFKDFFENYFSEVYDNVPGLDCGAGGTDIAVEEDETVGGIDAMLSAVGEAPVLAGVRWTVGEGFVIQFLGTEDMRYMLQEASSLTGAWTDVGTAVSALSGTNGLPRDVGASQMYWRVRQVP